MKILQLVLLLLVNYQSIIADQDSLLIKLNNAKLHNDTEELIDTYYKLGINYNQTREYQTALFYLDSGLELIETKEDSARYLKTIGKVFVDSTNYISALDHLGQALRIYEELDSREQIPEVHSLIGMCYGLTNNLDKAEAAFRNALDSNILISDSAGIAVNFYNIGLVNYFKGKYETAIDNYINSLKVRERLTDTTAIVTSLTSIGETFRAREDNTNAMAYYQRALEYRDAIKSDQTLAYIFSEVGLIHKSEKRYEAALSFLDSAMVYSKKAKYKRGIATLYSYKANIEKELGNITKAHDLHMKALKEYNDIGFEIGVVQSSIAIADIFYETGNFAGAMDLLNAISSKAEKNGLLEEQSQVADLKYRIYSAGNNSLQALASLELYNTLKDSLFNLDKEKQIEEIKTKYETEKKEQQILLLDKETKIQQQQLDEQKYILFGGIVLLILVVFIAILYVKQNKLKSRVAVEQGKLQLLRSQMNPHFIYNSLTAIQNFILQNNSMESVSYIGEFSSLMRLVLEGSRADFISVEDDIALVNYYLKLQKLRFNGKFEFSINKTDSVAEESMQMPPMLTQPFIENAVEHGMRGKDNNDGIISINYDFIKPDLIITIADNGSGIESGKNVSGKKHVSLATRITYERIANIEKLFKLKIGMETINSFEKDKIGTTVVFTIPQEEKM